MEIIIKPKLKAKRLTEVISTRSQKKSKNTITKRPQKNQNKNKKIDRAGYDFTKTKNPHSVATKNEYLEM